MEYNVCSIKIKTKMISLHKIEVEKISSFFEISLQSMVFYYYLLFFYYYLMLWLLSGPLGLLVGFLMLRYSVLFTVESLSLRNLLFIS